VLHPLAVSQALTAVGEAARSRGIMAHVEAGLQWRLLLRQARGGNDVCKLQPIADARCGKSLTG